MKMDYEFNRRECYKLLQTDKYVRLGPNQLRYANTDAWFEVDELEYCQDNDLVIAFFDDCINRRRRIANVLGYYLGVDIDFGEANVGLMEDALKDYFSAVGITLESRIFFDVLELAFNSIEIYVCINHEADLLGIYIYFTELMLNNFEGFEKPQQGSTAEVLLKEFIVSCIDSYQNFIPEYVLGKRGTLYLVRSQFIAKYGLLIHSSD